MSKILVVDDDATVRELCRIILTTEGFEVVELETGFQLLAAARREKPDLVLLDWMMPGMDGVDALRALKGAPSTRDIPVVMLTALDGLSEITVATYSGAEGYVTKPFEPDALISLVRRFTQQPA